MIYPKKDEEAFPEGKDYLVALEPFRILATLDTKFPYYARQGHGGVICEWQPDSSAALVTLESRWGPHAIFLFELHDEECARTTNLVSEMRRLLLPDYKKVKPKRYNEHFDFILLPDDAAAGEGEQSKEVPVAVLEQNSVRIRCIADTDPKEMPGVRAWKARLTAGWDISQHYFVQPKVVRLFGGRR